VIYPLLQKITVFLPFDVSRTMLSIAGVAGIHLKYKANPSRFEIDCFLLLVEVSRRIWFFSAFRVELTELTGPSGPIIYISPRVIIDGVKEAI
jgi:hypothetical protein